MYAGTAYYKPDLLMQSRLSVDYTRGAVSKCTVITSKGVVDVRKQSRHSIQQLLAPKYHSKIPEKPPFTTVGVKW